MKLYLHALISSAARAQQQHEKKYKDNIVLRHVCTVHWL